MTAIIVICSSIGMVALAIWWFAHTPNPKWYKYRLVELMKPDGTEYYIAQRRKKGVWRPIWHDSSDDAYYGVHPRSNEECACKTIEEAVGQVENYKTYWQRRYHNKVVGMI